MSSLASSKMMAAFFPPISKLSFFIMGAAMAAIFSPELKRQKAQVKMKSRRCNLLFVISFKIVLPTDHGRSCERYDSNIGISDNELARGLAKATDEVEDAAGNADFLE